MPQLFQNDIRLTFTLFNSFLYYYYFFPSLLCSFAIKITYKFYIMFICCFPVLLLVTFVDLSQILNDFWWSCIILDYFYFFDSSLLGFLLGCDYIILFFWVFFLVSWLFLERFFLFFLLGWNYPGLWGAQFGRRRYFPKLWIFSESLTNLL